MQASRAPGEVARVVRERINMSLIVDYLCDQISGDIKAAPRRLLTIIKWLWDRFLKRLLYDLAIELLASWMAGHLRK